MGLVYRDTYTFRIFCSLNSYPWRFRFAVHVNDLHHVHWTSIWCIVNTRNSSCIFFYLSILCKTAFLLCPYCFWLTCNHPLVLGTTILIITLYPLTYILSSFLLFLLSPPCSEALLVMNCTLYMTPISLVHWLTLLTSLLVFGISHYFLLCYLLLHGFDLLPLQDILNGQLDNRWSILVLLFVALQEAQRGSSSIWFVWRRMMLGGGDLLPITCPSLFKKNRWRLLRPLH